jgi:hypothetical protein
MILKIEITGGFGSGKDALARKIREMLRTDPFYNHAFTQEITVQMRLPRGVDGLPVVEGPDDATYQIIVHQSDD